MPIRDATKNYNTNLASEYLMMSLLNRAGIDAYLSLGNKKGVDIIINTKNDRICIVEVKGLNKKNDWFIGNNGKLLVDNNLFYALFCFNGKIEDLNTTADFWLIPSMKLEVNQDYIISKNKKTVYLSYRSIEKNYKKYFNNINTLIRYLSSN